MDKVEGSRRLKYGEEKPRFGRSEKEEWRKPSYESHDDEDDGYGYKNYVSISSYKI